MATEDEIRAQLSHLDGVSKWLGKREIKALPSVLWPTEVIQNGVQGTYNNRHGMLIATSSRLIFIDKSLTGRLRVEDFPYDKITSIQYEVGWVLGQIRIFASGNRADIIGIQKALVQPFAEMVRAKVTDSSAPSSNQRGSINSDLTAQIERLADMHTQGLLSAEEFATAKSRLLA